MLEVLFATMGRNIPDIRAVKKPSGIGRQGIATADGLKKRGASIKGMVKRLTIKTATRRTIANPTLEWSPVSLTVHARRTLVEEVQGAIRAVGGYDGL